MYRNPLSEQSTSRHWLHLYRNIFQLVAEFHCFKSILFPLSLLAHCLFALYSFVPKCLVAFVPFPLSEQSTSRHWLHLCRNIFQLVAEFHYFKSILFPLTLLANCLFALYSFVPKCLVAFVPFPLSEQSTSRYWLRLYHNIFQLVA